MGANPTDPTVGEKIAVCLPLSGSQVDFPSCVHGCRSGPLSKAPPLSGGKCEGAIYLYSFGGQNGK